MDKEPYAPTVMVRERMTIDPPPILPVARSASDAAGHAAVSGKATESTMDDRGLRLTLEEVTAEIVAQVRLRHSAYYENEVVLDRVADGLVEDSVAERSAIP